MAPAMDIDQLFAEHHERVFQAAFRISGNSQDAEDVLQTVFLNVIRRPPEVMTDPASYLCRAAINSSLDIVRRRPTDQSESLVAPGLSEATEPGLVEDELRDDLFRAHLRRALSAINPRGAEIFSLRYFEDFSNAEIAEILGTTASSIGVTLHRTRDQLKSLLREYDGGS
ncbi:MAG: sigma-70 family RNA polymerase sigma factor [Pseudomonadota bacterium]